MFSVELVAVPTPITFVSFTRHIQNSKKYIKYARISRLKFNEYRVNASDACECLISIAESVSADTRPALLLVKRGGIAPVLVISVGSMRVCVCVFILHCVC